MNKGTPRRTFLGQLAVGTAALAASRKTAAAPPSAARLLGDLEAFLGLESEKGPYRPREIHMAVLEDAELGCAKPRAAPEGRDGPPFGYAPIARRDHGHAVAEARQGRRERAAHVPQAARFRVRRRLRNDHEDVEHLRHSRRGAPAPDTRS